MSEETKYSRKSLIITLFVQVVLLTIIFFVVAWKAPFPPIPEFGIEITMEAIQENSNNEPETSKRPQESIPPSTIPSEDLPEELNQPSLVEDPENVKAEAPEEVVPTTGDLPIEEEKDTVSTSNDEQTMDSAEVIQEEEQSVIVVEEEEGPDEASSAEEGVPASQEEVKIDERALYGSPGQTSGASLQLTGWIWDSIPKPNDPSDETGKVTFNITIDNEGYITKISTQTSTLSPSVEQVYRNAIEQLTFSKTSDDQAASESKGTITFIIRAK